jgi:hypothetical protein
MIKFANKVTKMQKEVVQQIHTHCMSRPHLKESNSYCGTLIEEPAVRQADSCIYGQVLAAFSPNAGGAEDHTSEMAAPLMTPAGRGGSRHRDRQ